MAEEAKQKTASDPLFKLKAGLFLSITTGLGFLFGFGGALGQVKKQDPEAFDKGYLDPQSTQNFGRGTPRPKPSPAQLHTTGVALASRALAWGSLYAVLGVGSLTALVWFASGATTPEEFRYIVGSRLPRIPRNNPQGRTEFSGLNDLLQYIIDLDSAEKEAKQKRQKLASAEKPI